MHAEAYRLAAAEVPATPITGEECSEFGNNGLCFGLDVISLIVGIVGTAGTVWQIIQKAVVKSGKDSGDIIIIIVDQSDPNEFNYCAYAYSEEVKVGGCDSSTAEWIEVPTGGSYALESLYYYNKTGANNNMITDHSDSSPSALYLTHVLTGGEDLRTWFNTGESMSPILTPSPTPSPAASS